MMLISLISAISPAELRKSRSDSAARKLMNMKHIEETVTVGAMIKDSVPPPPPPPPPFPRFSVRKSVPLSVTNQEIAKFWRNKLIVEEDHLLAAIKAAARLRARNLSEEDYRCFEESLDDKDRESKAVIMTDIKNNEKNNEVRVGIKDWWTKSNYAYLNQPAMDSKDHPKRRTSNYVPNCFPYKPIPLYPTSLGVF
ncbi:hypothetical protein FEM48_Zijuj08G0083900 [Ziziphus jujuba var. spinosa]|uniref:Uncharacterized protein n=1 Tax=Ziziphus jujuba var. spinosa TaxID=714518 RepID=A0A978UY11_ZIZJJ|nr:hypothetical protein FEM48_Zijuj08G0083900 [Ziziphus jujuba var. spinosa]